MRNPIALLLLGVVIAGGVCASILYVEDARCQRFIERRVQAELARSIYRADSAYFNEPLVIARWELENLRGLLEEPILSHYEDYDRLNYYLFMTDARLARVYRDLGKDGKSKEYAGSALQRNVPSFEDVATAEALLERLEEIDHRMESRRERLK